jgi:hypothetical protein
MPVVMFLNTDLTMKEIPKDNPVIRRLWGYAFDPSLSISIDTVNFNNLVFKVPWDDYKRPGPTGEYVEVIDHDPASKCFYSPVDLNDIKLVASDGLKPTESDPHFHQQMVYAVSMTTIGNFEKALGRWIVWSPRYLLKDDGTEDHDKPEYVPLLRLYPHAIRDANAFYAPNKKAILFGYFPAVSENTGIQLPGGMVFTCLSHDIIAHEVTHAILDGINSKLIDVNNPDTLAFHEAFADIVALFQHFSFPEVIKSQIARTRGDLKSQNLLGELAQQFGQAIGNYSSLRSAIGRVNDKTKKWEASLPNPEDYITKTEPHDRGSILVATIFDAFIQVFKKRTADLFRIASSGTGDRPEGELHPDLLNRLTAEAAKSAKHILKICIRALDFLPPVDMNFGDFLRALITADCELMPEDDLNYRLIFIEAFRNRGIYPDGVKTLSIDSLRWQNVENLQKDLEEPFEQIQFVINDFLRKNPNLFSDRKNYFEMLTKFRRELHARIHFKLQAFEALTGLVFSRNKVTRDIIEYSRTNNYPSFYVQSLAFNRQIDPRGKVINQAFISIIQNRNVSVNGTSFIFNGGSTLVFDLNSTRLLYVIKKDILDNDRLEKRKKYVLDQITQTADNPFKSSFSTDSFYGPFASLHTRK